MSDAHAHRPHLATPGDRVTQAMVLAGAAGACVLLYAVDPAGDNDPYPSCPFRALTGYACPGCGTLRATNRLLHGDVGAAFGLNALFVLLVPVLLYTMAVMAANVTGRALPRPTLPRWTGYAFLVTVLIFWALRNIPVEPFNALAP